MDWAQRYAGYSLDDLHDVERHINRAKFPQTYAALVAEIKRREGAFLHRRIEPEAPWVRQARRRCRALLLASVLGCASFCVLSWWPGLPGAIAMRKLIGPQVEQEEPKFGQN